MNIKEPVRVLNFNELKKGDRIWSVQHRKWRVLTFVEVLSEYNAYGIFLNASYDGEPKFYENRLKEEKWYRYDDSDETWYHIYKAMTEDLKNDLKYYEECMKSIEEN